MRKSAAPSQSSKRSKFVVPFQQPKNVNSGVAAKGDLEGSKQNTTENTVLKRIFPQPSQNVDNRSLPIDTENMSWTNKPQRSVKCFNDNETEDIVDADVVPASEGHVAKISHLDGSLSQKAIVIEETGLTHGVPAYEGHVAKKPRLECSVGQKIVARKFVSPVAIQMPALVTTVAGADNNTSTAPVNTGYFSVVWCKRSNKKHKKWEGDAVLVTRGRTVTLYDMEGKDIGKGSGYKSGELASLREDETLPIGGKEIQVMSVLTENQFKSGKCFTGAGVVPATQAVETAPVKFASKPFIKPLKSSSDRSMILPTQEPDAVKPRYDPAVTGALVMPRPSETHQWKWNKKSLSVVDVVVDPYISSHLRPHQREGVTFLYQCIMGYRSSGYGAILADDMGLGKTLQCISLIWTLFKQGPYGGKSVVKRILVITPGSLVKNWYQEFKKWLGFERLQVFAVSSDKKVEEFMKTSIYPVLIISYEMFVRMYDIIQQLSFDLVVCDEGHRLKNTAIKTTSLIMSLPTKRRVVLTGTPIQNDLQEFFSIVEFCNPGILARQPGATPTVITLGEERGMELARMTQMFVLRRTQEINNKYLPPKCEIVVFCQPSPLQLELYKQLLRCQLIRSCLSGSLTGSPHLICIAALKQLCNHPSLIYKKSQDREEQGDSCDMNDSTSVYSGLLKLFPVGYCNDSDTDQHSGKLAVLSSLLHQIHHTNIQEKIVLVSNHTKTLDLIQTMCDRRFYKYLRLDGQTPTSKRQELVQRFNSRHSPEFIFLLSSKAGGVGLNLIGASRLVLFDIDWNPANDLQAMARVWRDGQKKKVHIYRFLTTGSIEEKVYQRQISKQGLSGAIMDVHEKNNVQFSMEDLRDLFSINLATDCDTHDLLNCDCKHSGDDKREPVKQIISRSCQLGASAKTKKWKRNLGMDELMEWSHVTGSAVKDHPDWYLQEASEKISFVFHSEVKNST